MYLAFFGAEVIKVESEDLDDNRTPGQTTFQDLNRGKLSCTIDMRTVEGKRLIHELVEQCDVVAENFRPTVMDRSGIGYESLRAVRPDLVMIAMPGMGNTGPLSSYFCYGQQIMGVAGLTYLWGHPDGPLDTRIKMPFADYVAALFGALSVAAALEYRDRTGQGQYIELAQVEGAAHLLSVGYLDYLVNGRAPLPVGNRSDVYAPHGVYPCLGHDAWIAVEVGTEGEWKGLVRALGNPRWAQDERFATHQARLANADALDALIAEWTKQFTPRQAMRILQRNGVPAGMVSNGEDLHGDPHLRARPAAIVEAVHPDAGWMEHQGINVGLSLTPGDAGVPAPTKGQHNDYVFQKVLGMPAARQQELESAGALR
jgi:benzylsuccinate CoA-transferase BbsF subunit